MDMKQSIYGFRQADPSGFKKYNQYIRKINKMEFDSISSLTRDPPLRKRNKSRDPRYDHQIARHRKLVIFNPGGIWNHG